jgi:hypothetical protein
VDGIGVVRYRDAVSGQLVTESYRPRTGDRRRYLQAGDLRGQLLRSVDRRFPDPLAARLVERSEDLAPPAVQDRQPQALGPGLADPGREGVERADPAHRQATAGAEPARGRDPDPQAGEGAGTEPDGDQIDRLPTPGGLDRPLDLAQQAGRVPGPPLWGEPQLRLVKNLAVAPGAGDGVNRRGVETDDDQGFATP